MVKRMLKCPKCSKQSALIHYGIKYEGAKVGFVPVHQTTHQHYHQKYCRECGYEGRKVYGGMWDKSCQICAAMRRYSANKF
jgi:predicted nucleic-acid-binding Zn-ribbon protein